MGTLVIFEATAKPDSVESLVEFLQRHIPDTRSYDGCREIDAYLHEDGRSIVMVERWDSKEHYQKYLGWRDETGVLAEFGTLLEAPPDIRFFEYIET